MSAMRTVLVTGGTGVLGSLLIPRLLEKGYRVYAIYRNSLPQITHPNLVWLGGDVLMPGLGISGFPKFDAVYHAAGSVNLSSSRHARDEVMLANGTGTYNVCRFVAEQDIERFVHISTAYLFNRNWYERSKEIAEGYANVLARGGYLDPDKQIRCKPISVTIHRPSILIGDPNAGVPFQAFGEFIHMMARIHRRAEFVRKRIEGSLRLPPIQAILRIRGNADSHLNLIPVPDVAGAVADIDEPGVFYLTNDSPPRLSDLAEWVGESLWLDIRFDQDFKPNPLESLFHKLAKSFLPYLDGDNFPSDIQCSRVDKALVQRVADSVCLT